MGNDLVPKDLRYIDKVHGKTIKTKKQAENKRRRIRDKRINDAKREMEEREDNLRRYKDYLTPTEQYAKEVGIAKSVFANFMRRTGTIIELDGVHWRINRRGQKVLLVMEEMFPMKGRSWRNFTPIISNGHRPWLNQTQLRQLCVRLSVPYWDRMTTKDMRAALLILAWMDNLDPEKFFWQRKDYIAMYGEEE